MNNALVKVIEKSQLQQADTDNIYKYYQEFENIASEWESKAKEIIVTDESQTETMKQAREGRLFLKQTRVNVEKTRKELKEKSLRESQVIDGIAKALKDLITPIEEHLDRQEKFIEIKEQERKQKLYEERISILEPLEVNSSLYDLRNMSDDDFSKLVDSTKESIRLKKEEEIRLENERIAREKAEAEERERMRIENERLKKEREEQDRLLAIEREKREAEERAKKEALDKLEAEKLAQEQAEKEKIERQNSFKEKKSIFKKITNRSVLNRLSKMTDKELDQEFLVYDKDNDCRLNAWCFGDDLHEERTETMDCEDNALVVTD